MIPATSSASISVSDLPTLAFEAALTALDGFEASKASVVELSSADLSLYGPISTLGGGVRTLRSNEVPSAPIADPLIGMIVADRYRIVEPIGRGGMGIVYKVEHTRIGKLLAMKVLTGELSRNPAVVRRFKREALTVSRLQCPNTVQVFDFGVSEGLTYLVMELVHGDNLGRVLRDEGPLPSSRLGKIIIQICSSLAEAHQKGIVHRDIKPENIMIVAASDGADVAKVLDFGLAKLREATNGEGLNDITGHGQVMGTPHYMAPEQVRGEEVDARTDIYSVGALMYRLLTGYHLFSGASPVTVLGKHLAEIPIPPAERVPALGIPRGMSRLVMRALSKRPEDRFQSIEELQALLVEEVRAAGSASVERLLDPTRLLGEEAREALATRDEVDAYERKLRRQRFGAAGLGAALLVTAAAVGISLLVPRDARLSGVEIEPNDTAAEATPLPLGKPMTGYLGKRIDASHGDRDFYSFDLPARAAGRSGGEGASAFLRLKITALPNLPMCAMLYKPGFTEAIGQYCVGRPGRDLMIPALRLEPGRYLLAVMQDMDAYGGAPPFLHENISDAYTILAESTEPEPGAEIEPNDKIASATPLGLGQACSASIGYSRDEDVFCVSPAVTGKIRWRVQAGFSESGVIEATPMKGEEEGAPVRIHPDATGKRSGADEVSPWQSAPIAATGAEPRCLRVRLTTDPWAERAGAAPGGGSAPYSVEADAVP